MKELVFVLHGVCTVPDGVTPVDGIANQFRLPSGEVISVQPVIEMASGVDADDHRCLSHSEAVARDLFLEIEERSSDIYESAD